MTRTKWYWPCRMHPKNTVESWKLIKSSCRIDVVQTFCKMSSTCHLLSSVPSHQKSAQVSAVVESKSPNRTIQAHIIGNVCVVVEGIPVFWNFIPIYIYCALFRETSASEVPRIASHRGSSGMIPPTVCSAHGSVNHYGTIGMGAWTSRKERVV